MFKKPKRNFRQRGCAATSDASSDSDGITVLSDPESEPPTTLNHEKPTINSMQAQAKTRSKKKKPVDRVALSFADEEEEGEAEVFQVKKSLHSRRIARKLRQQRRDKQGGAEKTGVDCRSRGVTDSSHDDHKPVANDNAKKSPSNGFRQQSVKGQAAIAADVDGGLVSQSANKSDVQTKILSGRDAEFADYQSSDDEQNNHQGASASLRRPAFSIRRALQDGVIPDASMIHAVRKRRELARRNAEPDFMPISESSTRRGGNGDESGGEEETAGRVDLSTGETAEQQRRNRQLQYDLAHEQEEEHQSTEISTWESQQLMKAISGSQRVTGDSALAAGLLRLNTGANSSCDAAEFADVDHGTGHVQSSALSAGMSLLPPRKQKPLSELTADKVRQRLADKLSELRAARDDLTRRLDNTVDQLVASQRSVDQMDSVTPHAVTRFHYYQDIRGYVTDMIECFNEKVPLIDALSERFLSVFEHRCRYLSQRRHEDTRDQRRQLETSDGSLQRVSSSAMALDVELTAAEVERRQRRTAEREGRRMRRRRQRELMASRAGPDHPKVQAHADGMSSDDEIPAGVTNKLDQDIDAIRSEAGSVFADVHDEFATLSGVCRHFSEWRYMDPKAYKQAFVSFSLPQALAPLVRLATIDWNPIVGPIEECFDQCDWYVSLAGYCLTEDSSVTVDDSSQPPRSSSETLLALSADPDRLLISRAAELSLAPRLLQLVRRCWDPLSHTQSSRLCATVRRVHAEFVTLTARGDDNDQLNQLLTAVIDKYVYFIKNELYIPRYPAQVLKNRSSSATVFFLRQLHSSIKLLGSASCWYGVLDDDCLQRLCLVEILANQLMMALALVTDHEEALHKCTLILDALPKAWFTESCPQQMSMFVSFLSILASQVFKSGSSTKLLNGIASLLLRIKSASAYARVMEYIEQRGST